MKSIDAQSCRALKSRGSRTSRRIVIRTSTNGLPNQEAIPRILFCAQRNTPIFICDSPAFTAGTDQPSNPFLQTVMRKPLSKTEWPMPVGIVSNNYSLVNHLEIAEICRNGLAQ